MTFPAEVSLLSPPLFLTPRTTDAISYFWTHETWNNAVYFFVSGFFHSTLCLWDSSTWGVAIVRSILIAPWIPLYNSSIDWLYCGWVFGLFVFWLLLFSAVLCWYSHTCLLVDRHAYVDYMPGGELPSHRQCLLSCSRYCRRLSSSLSVYPFSNSVWPFQLLHVVTNTWYCVFNFNHFAGCGYLLK